MGSTDFLTLAEIASALRYSRETVRRKVVKGVIPGGYQDAPGSEWRVSAAGYEQYLAKSARKNTDDTMKGVIVSPR